MFFYPWCYCSLPALLLELVIGAIALVAAVGALLLLLLIVVFVRGTQWLVAEIRAARAARLAT